MKIGYSDIQGHLVSDDFTFTEFIPPDGVPPARVPEPTTLLLLSSGLAGLAALRRRREAL